MMSLPTEDFAPDLFEMEEATFGSRRFREALAQPADVVQYWPAKVARASDEAYRQEYTMLRILACQPALDLERSEYTAADCLSGLPELWERGLPVLERIAAAGVGLAS
jgi:hypothetical protein